MSQMASWAGQAFTTAWHVPAPKRTSHRSRSALPTVAAFVPYGEQPVAAPPSVEALKNSQLVFSLQQPAFPSFLPTLEAPRLTWDAATDIIDRAATQPHWGLRTAAESLQAASQLLQAREPPGFRELASTLGELQAALTDSMRQLARLPEQQVDSLQQLGGIQVSSLKQVVSQLQQVAAAAQQAATSLSQGGLGSQLAQLGSTTHAGYRLQTLAMVAAGVAALVALSVPRDDGNQPGSGSGGSGGKPGSSRASSTSSSSDGGDVLPSTWDAEAVGRYYRQRPALVARRVVQVASEACSYGAALLADMAAGAVERNQAERADQAMAAIERLGPAYVKVAQALSTRVDLLPPAYLFAIQRLQDRVPPFADAQAYACIERAFGAPLGQVFSQLSDTAVAAASLGQVYRGTLRATGQDVAIKVRRPDVLESVTLDLYLMRGVAAQLNSMPEVKSDWVGIIDNWAGRFLQEMDYLLEAANTRQFAADLAALPGVVIPGVVAEGTTSDVLITTWVEGERLSDSSAGDVRQLCDTLLSAYLIQLLDTGLLHADPHPGNLLRTTDGRIAILDHGLIQEVPRDYSLALMEYIAHLSVGDWNALADDLVNLGFVDDISDRERLVGPLGRILTQLTQGGGAKNINIAVVTQEIEKLSQEFEFKVPPYFALILRTFSVIEGIALQVDPNYSIVKECFPYMSRRLLTDDDPRAREALRQLLFAGGDQLSLERVERMVEGLSSFTVDGLAAPPGSAGQLVGPQRQASEDAPLLDSTAKEVLQAVFSQRPTYVQELLVEQAVNTTDAAARQLAALLLSPALGNIVAVQTAMQGNGQMGSASLPPALALLTRLPSLVALSAEDQQQLQTAQGISNLLRQQQPQQAQLTPRQAAQLAQELAPLLPSLLPGIAATGQLFVRQLGQRAYSRVAAVVREEKRGEEYSALD